jgi:hypothetical protein
MSFAITGAAAIPDRVISISNTVIRSKVQEGCIISRYTLEGTLLHRLTLETHSQPLQVIERSVAMDSSKYLKGPEAEALDKSRSKKKRLSRVEANGMTVIPNGASPATILQGGSGSLHVRKKFASQQRISTPRDTGSLSGTAAAMPMPLAVPLAEEEDALSPSFEPTFLMPAAMKNKVFDKFMKLEGVDTPIEALVIPENKGTAASTHPPMRLVD